MLSISNFSYCKFKSHLLQIDQNVVACGKKEKKLQLRRIRLVREDQCIIQLDVVTSDIIIPEPCGKCICCRSCRSCQPCPVWTRYVGWIRNRDVTCVPKICMATTKIVIHYVQHEVVGTRCSRRD